MSKVYLIEKIWVDWLENRTSDAVGYETVGYVETLEEAEKICDQGRDYDVNDCWAIIGKMPEYKFKAVEKYGSGSN